MSYTSQQFISANSSTVTLDDDSSDQRRRSRASVASDSDVSDSDVDSKDSGFDAANSADEVDILIAS